MKRVAGNTVRALTVTVAVLLAGPVRAQDTAPADTTTAGGSAPVGGLAGASRAANQGETQGQAQNQDQNVVLVGPWFVSIANTPKAEMKASVSNYQYLGEWVTTVKMRGGSAFTNTLDWSWTDYRKQDKTIQRRQDQFTWTGGALLPVTTSISGTWDWSEDKTVNNAGTYSLAKNNAKRAMINLSKNQLRTGRFVHNVRASAQLENQKGAYLNQRNDRKGLTGVVGGQTGFSVAPGVILAGRLWGSSFGGTTALGDLDSPSTDTGDSLGVGVYYDRQWATGFLQVARANFAKRHLDYRRGATGAVDTMGVPDALKIVQEKQTNDATAVDFKNTLLVGAFTLKSTLSRTATNEDYAASLEGRTENREDAAAVELSVATGRDSLMVSFGYNFQWKDRKYKNATSYRGRQYNKTRDLTVGWFRELFTATQLGVKLHQGLSQDIAENEFNANDKDRLDSDVNLSLNRDWTNFNAQMQFNYKQSRDLSIRDSRSASNNVKDWYQVAPTYTWDLAEWLALTQTYALAIQYTDYLYSDLPSVGSPDDYNKRGNLTSQVVLSPSDRLELVLKHVYSKTFNAVEISSDAAGNSQYFTNKIKRTSTIDLGLQYEAADGVALLAATQQEKNTNDTLGDRNTREIKYRGKMAVGIKVSKGWGEGNIPPIQLSADVKKNYAFGDNVTPTNRDYWDADVWLKWSF